MKQPTWKFRQMSRGEINVDPIEGEVFSTEILGSLSDAVIREAIQNSLDAGTPGQQVKIVITFSSPDQRLELTRRRDTFTVFASISMRGQWTYKWNRLRAPYGLPPHRGLRHQGACR